MVENNERLSIIYYRYHSLTEEIRYADLKHILDSEVGNIFRSLVENITLFQKIGYDKAGIVDLENLSLANSTTSIYLTTESISTNMLSSSASSAFFSSSGKSVRTQENDVFAALRRLGSK